MRRILALFSLVLWLPSSAGAETQADAVTIHRSVDRVVYEQGPIRAAPFLDEGTSELYIGTLTLAPGTIVPPHTHEGSVEILTILSGKGVMQLGGESVPVGPGATIHIPAGVLHDFAVSGTRAVEAIQIYSPKGPDARFRQWTPVHTDSKAP